MARTKELDMLNGALLPKLMMFSLPLALTGILQLLFNAADVIVVGKFAGSTSLAAVGATSALINLLTGAFIGISVGVNILVARYIGCRDDAGVSRAVHSAITLSLLLGVVTFLLGFFLSTPMLELMGTPDDVLRLASLYLRIYFIGIPGALIYNFAAAILRAYGDTKRPLIFLAISGVLNVFLNLFFEFSDQPIFFFFDLVYKNWIERRLCVLWIMNIMYLQISFSIGKKLIYRIDENCGITQKQRVKNDFCFQSIKIE